MGWRITWRRVRRWTHQVKSARHYRGLPTRWVTTPPPADESYVGWRARWLGTSMWCRTPGDQPDIEISRGTKGTVTEFVRADYAGRGYRITFDNGAVFGTSLPALWAIELTRDDTPPERARAS